MSGGVHEGERSENAGLGTQGGSDVRPEVPTFSVCVSRAVMSDSLRPHGS